MTVNDDTGAELAVEEEVRPFAELLHLQRNGAFHADLSTALNRLVRAVQETGKGGDLTVKLKVKPAGKHATMVLVHDDVKLKEPEADKGDGIYFTDERGNLRRSDPNQPELPLREVPQPQRRPAREVPS